MILVPGILSQRRLSLFPGQLKQFISRQMGFKVTPMLSNLKRRIEKAQKNLQRGKAQEALDEYLLIYREDPTDLDVLRTIAELYQQTHRIDEAVQTFQTLIDQAAGEGAFNKVLFYHRKIIKLMPQDATKVVDLAHFLVHHNRIQDAVVEYQNAAELHLRQKQPNSALHCYERIVELQPNDARSLEQLGRFGIENRQTVVAERSFLRAAKEHLALKQFTEAQTDFELALKANPENVETIHALAQLHSSQGCWDKVVELMEAALKEHPMQADVLEHLGEAYFHQDQIEKADMIWTRLFQVRPETYTFLIRVAERWIQMKNFTNAYQLAMKIKEYCFRTHQYAVLTGLLESILEQAPNDTTLLSQLASIHLSLNNREAYRQCLEKMYSAYIAAGNFPVAAEVLDNLLSVNPGDLEHLDRLELLRSRIPPESLSALEAHLRNVEVYRRSGDQKAVVSAEAPRGIEPAVPIPQSANEILEDLFLQAELFVRFHMPDRAVVPLNKIEKLLPLPEEYQVRYTELCSNVGRSPAASKSALKSPEPSPLAAGSPLSEDSRARKKQSSVGGEIELLAALHRKIHLQQGTKAVLYTAVNELGRFLETTRCFAALSTTSKPISTYIEYCCPGRGKSETEALKKLLQMCEATVVAQRQPLVSDRALEDSRFEKISAEMRTLSILSMVVWPMLSQNQVVGYLGLQQGDEPRVWTGEEILILQTVSEQVSVALAHAKLRYLVKTLAVIDEDTGLISRHSFFDCLMSEIDRARRQASTLSLALVELDQLAEVERQRGAFQALEMLRDFAQFVVTHTRETDTAAKFDRSIIGLILPDTTHSEAEWVVQKIHSLMANESHTKALFPSGENVPHFYSAAAEALVTANQDPSDAATDVVFRAEQALAQVRTTPSSQPAFEQSFLRR